MTQSACEFDQLISQARAGCTDSLGQLLELYRGYLSLMVRLQAEPQFQGKFSPSDVVQDTYTEAMQGFALFAGQSEGELVSWLRKILACRLATQVRHYATQRRDVKLERQLDGELEHSSLMLSSMLTDPGRTPSQSAIRRENAVILADALAQLSEDHREVIVLRHLRGESFLEVARRMDRSVDSIKGLWRRAIGKLRTFISDGVA